MPEPILHKDSFLKPASAERKDGITITEVVTKKQLQAFIDFPYQLYRGNKYYVPPLKQDISDTFNKEKNPALEFCEVRFWLAYRGHKIVGRLAGIINRAYIEKWKNSYMRFGWMDFEEDEKIVTALLNEVEKWAKETGMTAVHGPLGFTNFDQAGFLTEGFDQLGTFATIYNYPYYPSFIENAGYRKDTEWVEYNIKVPETMPDKLVKIAEVVQKRYGLQVVRGRNTKEILAYARDIFELINDAYSGLYGMVALNEKQIRHNTKKYLSFIRPEYVSIVLDKDGRLAAFGITMPSLSVAMQKAKGKLYPFGFIQLMKAFRKNNRVDMLLVAVRKDLQGKGVNALLMNELNRTYIRKGIRYAESNPELVENTKVQRIWSNYDAVQHKRRRSYIKFL